MQTTPLEHLDATVNRRVFIFSSTLYWLIAGVNLTVVKGFRQHPEHLGDIVNEKDAKLEE